MRYFKVLILLICSLAVTACHDGKATEALDNAEALMAENPDQALELLEGMDTRSIRSKSDKARYALLKSMALDKNYIDTTTFNVIQPAIDYYEKHGTPDDKLRTYYYEGRIYQNRTENDNAIDLFLKAYSLDGISDSIMLAHALTVLGYEYDNRYEFEGSIEANLRAARIYNHYNRDNYMVRGLLNALNGAIIKDQEELADSILHAFEDCKGSDSEWQQSLIEHRLAYVVNFGSEAETREYIKFVEQLDSLSNYGVLTLANAYEKLGDYDNALKVIERLKDKLPLEDSLKLLSTKVIVLEKMRDYSRAFKAQNDFYILQDSVDVANIKYKTQLIEDRHRIELNAANDSKRKDLIILGCILGLVVLTAGVVIASLIARSNKIKNDLANERAKVSELENRQLRERSVVLESEKRQLVLENQDLHLESEKQKQEAERLAERVRQVEEESCVLKALIHSHEKLPPEVQKAIKDRAERLNSVMAEYIKSEGRSDKKLREWVEELTADRDEFMESTRLAFKASHPDFIKYFEDHGLTQREINYVCLYAIGLNGKEVGNYMDMKGHKNISSTIRAKLGLGVHDTNLSIIVRNLLRDC